MTSDDLLLCFFLSFRVGKNLEAGFEVLSGAENSDGQNLFHQRDKEDQQGLLLELVSPNESQSTVKCCHNK